jgi:hypothetical protein
MKKYAYKEAVHIAVDKEYSRPAPESLRLKIRALIRIPLVKPWQFVGSVALILISPLCFYLITNRLVYSENMLLILNVSAGLTGFLIIFAGVAHRYADPQQRTDLVDKVNALRAKI